MKIQVVFANGMPRLFSNVIEMSSLINKQDFIYIKHEVKETPGGYNSPTMTGIIDTTIFRAHILSMDVFDK